MKTFYTVDDGYDTSNFSTLENAREYAKELKGDNQHPERTIYISRVTDTDNGALTDTLEEL